MLKAGWFTAALVALFAACDDSSRSGSDDDDGAGGGGGSAGASTSATGGAGPVFTVSGFVQIVNAPGGLMASVILASTTTFDPTAVNTAAPLGPRVEGVTGAWTIPNVPNGSYHLLVAYENDGLVLDPSSMAQFDVVEVVGADVEVGARKVTGAIPVVSPDGGETATNPVTFHWQDDASEDSYDLVVVDASGSAIWSTEVPAFVGATVSVEYGGPALAPGALYQFRATSMKGEVPLSRTEDLRGTFVAP